MPLEIKSVFAVAKTRGVKMLVYGRSGVGKTMLLATAPVPVIASAEAGLLSLSAENQQRVFGAVVDIPVVEITTLDDLIQFHEWMVAPSCPYETICIDSITEIGEKVLANALAQVKDPRQAYGELAEKITAVLKQFRDIDGKHVVFVAKETTNKDNAVPLHVPAMPGSKVGPGMPYYFDEVFHLAVHEIKEGPQAGDKYRALQTEQDLQFDAKDRSGALARVEEPNLTNVIAKIIH